LPFGFSGWAWPGGQLPGRVQQGNRNRLMA